MTKERFAPPKGWRPLSVDEQVAKYQNASPYVRIPTPEEIAQEKSDLLAKIHSSVSLQPTLTQADPQLTATETEWQDLQKKADKNAQLVSQRRREKKQAVRSKPLTDPSYHMEGKGGIHETMQKRPPKNPFQPSLLDQMVVQEQEDGRMMNPRDRRYGPDHNLTWSQYQVWARNFIPGWKDLSPEEKFNYLMQDEENRRLHGGRR